MKVFIDLQKKKISLSLLLLIFVVSILGITYAYYRFSFIQNDKSIASSSCFKVTLEDLSDAIVLNDLHPKSDEEGLNGASYSFNVKNICNTYVTYQVNLEDILDDTITKRLSNKYIKVSLNDSTPKILNTYQSVTPTINNASMSFKLTSGSLGPKGSSNDNVSYNLKFWMDYDTPAIDEVMSATFKSKISVISTYVREDALNNELAFNYSNFIDSNGDTSLSVKATSSNYNITEYSFDGSSYTVLDNPGKDINIKNLKRKRATKIYLKDEVGNIITKDIVGDDIDVLIKNTDTSINIKLNNTSNMGITSYEYSIDNNNFYTSNDDTYTFDNLDTINNNYIVYVKANLTSGDSLIYQSKVEKEAKIDNVYYATLDYALNSVSDSGNDIVYLLKDVDKEVIFNENKKASLNLNGHSITCSKEADVLFTNNGDLKILNGNISSNQMKTNIILNNGKIELENVVVRSDKETDLENDGAVFYNKGEALINAEIYSNKENAILNGTSDNTTATMVIDGSTIDTFASAVLNNANLEIKSGNITTSENALHNSGGTSTISGGTFKSIGTYVAIYNEKGTLNISGGEFSGEQRGILTNFDKANITGGTFTSTQTGYYNILNGTSSNTTATMVIDGSTIDTVASAISNYANLEIKSGNITTSGNALYNSGGTSTISGGTLKGTGTKAAIYNEKGTLNISGGEFSSEQAGLVSNLDKANITGGTFTSTQTGYYNIQNGTSSNNVASMIIDGAVFDVAYNFVNYGDLEIKRGDITTSRYALYNKGGTSTISGGTLKGTGTKVAIYNEKGTLNISGGEFSGEQVGILTNLDKANITGGIFTSTQTGYYNISNGTSSNTTATMVIDGSTIDTVASAISNYANLEIKSGDITTSRYALYNSDGTSTISGGTLKATGTKVAIYNEKGTLNISGGEFSSEQYGILTNLDKANITGGIFISIQTAYYNIQNGTSSNTTATMIIDGAVFDVEYNIANYGDLEMKSGDINATEYALYNISGTSTISGGTIVTGNANAIKNKANLIINGTACITNNASSYPTIYNYAGSTITTDLTNVIITNNGGGETIYNAS